MNSRIIWKFVFFLSLMLTIYTINGNLKMPVDTGEIRPSVISYGVLIFDLLILIGGFGYAFKIKMLKPSVWKVTAVMYPLFILLETAFDFYAGGYVMFEMVSHFLFVFLLTSLFVAPVVMYLDDFKVAKLE